MAAVLQSRFLAHSHSHTLQYVQTNWLQEAAGSFLLGRTPSGEAEIFCGTIVCLRDDQLFCAFLAKFDTEVSERTLPLLGRVSSFDENMPCRDS